MSSDSLSARARRVWEQLAGVPVEFPAVGDVSVVVSGRSRWCPPGWVGLVALGGAVVVTAPDEARARLFRERTPGSVLVADVLGPAALAYLDVSDFRRPMHGDAVIDRLSPGHPDLRAFADSVGPDDAGESGVVDIESPVFVLRDGPTLLAAAGYEVWAARTAHLCVLVAPRARGRGFARQVAGAAVEHALGAGLLPQWRARPLASRNVAAALGFRSLGGQLSVLVVDGAVS